AGTVLRKKDLLQSPKAVALPPRAAPTPAAGGTPEVATGEGPFEFGSKKISTEMPSEVNVGPHDGDTDVTFPSGTGTLKDGKLSKLDVKPSVSIAQLGTGDNKIQELASDGKMVQVIGTPSTKANDNPWEWADKLGQFELVDNAGKSYKPRGAWVQVKMTSGNFEDRVAAKYDADSD